MKKMLYISIMEENNQTRLHFEIEDYFSGVSLPYARINFDTLSKEKMLQDYKHLDFLGFNLLVRILHPRFLCDRYGRRWALAVYPFDENGVTSLDIDEEPYRENPGRKFCGTILLETTDKDTNLKDDLLIMRIAHAVLKYLPLPEQQDA